MAGGLTGALVGVLMLLAVFGGLEWWEKRPPRYQPKHRKEKVVRPVKVRQPHSVVKSWRLGALSVGFGFDYTPVVA